MSIQGRSVMNLRTRGAALLLAAPLALGACSSGGQAANSSGASGASGTPSAAQQNVNDPFAAQPGAEVDTSAFLQGTQQAMQAKKTYHLTMSMAGQGQGQAVKMEGQGDVSNPQAPKMQMKMTVPGQASGGAVNMILDGQNMYMQIPGQAGGKYVKVSMAELARAGGQDIQKMMNPAENLKASEAAIEKITYKGEEDVAGTKLKHYSMQMDPAKAQQAMGGSTGAPQPSASGTAQKVPYDVWVDGDNLMRKMTMTMQGTKLEMNIDKYGEPVSIAAPPTASVTTMPGLGSGGSSSAG